jgi:hypothetical protein
LFGEPRPITVRQQMIVGRAGVGLGSDDGAIDGVAVMAVNARNDLPAVGFEAFRRVVGEPALDMAVDRNAVVVVEDDQLAQSLRAGQRAHFVRNAFHQATVAGESVGVMVDDGMSVAVELRSEAAFRDRHAHRVCQTLTQRAGRGFHARCVAVFRVAGRLRMQLPECLEVVDRQVVAGQVQQRIQQHRTVSVRQHEAVAVGPVGIGRIVAQVTPPQHFRNLRHAHRCTGVTGIGFLHGIHRQCPDGTGDRIETCAGGYGRWVHRTGFWPENP